MSTGKVIALVLVVCGSFGVLLVVACAGLLFMGYRSANASVTPEIDRLFAAIDNGSFADTYETVTTPEFRNVTSKEQYADIGKAVAVGLGRLKSKKLRAYNMRVMNAQSLVDVSYNATFEKGPATISAKMKNQGGEWKLLSFHVVSPVSQQNLLTAKCIKCGAPHARNARFCPACGAAIPGAGDNKEAQPAESIDK